MDFVKIDMKTFVKLVGVLGVENIGRNEAGTSWLLPDGRIAAEIHNGTDWEYVLVREEDHAA